ncbi:efflux RND transporter periplasmic adaptor subunit [Falsirhodobacter sp. 1013]|uniref:efflux RND transporter periplasmic adaptor subunit n=1 Tax=Falsirhodobacter sp. 1013 TaxID=3417566 RepID=UPI003EBCC2EC
MSPVALKGAALGLMTACLAGSLPALGQDQPAPTVTTMSATPVDFVLSARLPGRIKASTVAEVRPQVSGIIRERLFEEGSIVQAGQPLYKIEDEVYAAQVQASQASVAQARANYDLAVVDATRAQNLFSSKTGSQANLDTSLANRDAAAASLQAAQAQLKSAEIDLERTTVRAPVTGVIGLSQATSGSLVGAGQTTILTIIRTLDPVYVDVTQSAADLLKWNSSAESRDKIRSTVASMILPNGETYAEKGLLTAAEPQVEATTGMVTLRITFPNPDMTLLPGLYVEVELPQTKAPNAIPVPQDAVMRDAQGNASAWVVEDGKVAVRPLTILTSDDGKWITTSGLKAGDAVVTSGFQKAAPGAAVEVVAPTQPAAGGEGN